jgi:predicted Zn-dependent protease
VEPQRPAVARETFLSGGLSANEPSIDPRRSGLTSTPYTPLEVGEYVARKEKLLAMLETDPGDPFLHYALAKELLSAGETEPGVSKLRGVIDRFPEYHAAHFQLAQTLSEQGQTEEARQVTEQGILAAKQAGDAHAVSEMTGFLELL